MWLPWWLQDRACTCTSCNFSILAWGTMGFNSGKEKAHKHKQISPVTARAGGGSPDRVGEGSPDRWPGVKSLCAVCGTQGTSTFSSGYRKRVPGREDRWPGWPRNCLCWEPARPLQRSLRPSGPKMPKKSRKCLPGPPAPGPQKVSKKSRNTPKTLSRHFPETLRRLARLSQRLFWDFLGSRGRGPRETFSRLFWHFGPGGPGRPL